jgi:rhodanese-related sulfurtransferase
MVADWRKYIILLAVFGLAAGVMGLAYLYAVDSPFRLHESMARAKLLKGELTTVVDVRTDIEYWAGHYPGSVHIPVGRLLEEAYQTLPNLEEGILIYCNTGQRARHGAEVLRSLGYKNVYYIAGPYWSIIH